MESTPISSLEHSALDQLHQHKLLLDRLKLAIEEEWFSSEQVEEVLQAGTNAFNKLKQEIYFRNYRNKIAVDVYNLYLKILQELVDKKIDEVEFKSKISIEINQRYGLRSSHRDSSIASSLLRDIWTKKCKYVGMLGDECKFCITKQGYGTCDNPKHHIDTSDITLFWNNFISQILTSSILDEKILGYKISVKDVIKHIHDNELDPIKYSGTMYKACRIVGYIFGMTTGHIRRCADLIKDNGNHYNTWGAEEFSTTIVTPVKFDDLLNNKPVAE